MVEKLKDILTREDTVIFVGSGISLWSGLPTWSGLIKLLAEFIKENGRNSEVILKELDRNDLFWAASYGWEQLTKKQRGQFIQKACGIDTAMPHDIHRRIVTLGPTCFVTTNYDRLLEASFQQWLPNEKFNIVLNTQPSGQADIRGARASHFLYKYHGDAGQTESIILSRDQYQMVKPEGKLRYAFMTMQTLMLTRPFVYIGFGLKDADYWHVQDIILNTYNKGLKDHLAIMPDLTDYELKFYKKKYNIDLISYKTDATRGKQAHASLLDLLDQLKPSLTPPIKRSANIIDESFILNLARYAARYASFEEPVTHIPLIAFQVEKDRHYRYQNNGQPIEKLLDNNPQVMILTGLPGSGKSFALKKSVTRLAVELRQDCLGDPFQTGRIAIPVIADLKLYQGNVWKLLEESLPVEIELDFLINNFKVKIFLDAFNEMPREYIESNQWNADFSHFLTKIGNASLVISSRTYHGLDHFKLPVYSLDVIDKTFVEQQLDRSQIKFKAIFKRDIVSLLQRPFFYKLILGSNNFALDENITPKKVYDNLIHSIQLRFQQHFATAFDLMSLLAQVAVEAIDSGHEAFPIGIINNRLDAELSKEESLTPENIVNWLIGEDFLIPIPGGKISFFHQSVTEYLAAGKLAELFINNPGILKEKLQYTRWDQALLLVLNFLSKKKSEEFLNAIKKIDFDLAIDAVKYLEGDKKDLITDKFLIALANHEKGSRFFIPTVEIHLALTEYHIPTLRKLVERKGKVGGVAFAVLLNFLSINGKQEGFDLLIKNLDDDDFCHHVCLGLNRIIVKEDLPQLINLFAILQRRIELERANDIKVSVKAGPLVMLFQKFDLTTVAGALYDPEKSKEAQKDNLAILRTYLKQYGTMDALAILLDLAEGSPEQTFNTLYHFRHYSSLPKEPRFFSFFQPGHLPLLSAIIEKENDHYQQSITFAKMLCHYRREFLSYFKDKAAQSKGVLKLCYLYFCSIDNDFTQFFSALKDLAQLEYDVLRKERLRYLYAMNEIVWQGNEPLLVEFLKHDNEFFVYAIYLSFQYRFGKKMPLVLDIGPISWWLERYTAILKDKESLFHHAPLLLFKCIPEEKKMEFIDEFNKPGSPYRKVLVRSVLPNLESIKLGDFNEDAIQYLLNRQNEPDFYHQSRILEMIATEEFTVQRIIPLLKGASGKYLQYLQNLLRQLGNKHKRRYLLK